MGAFLTASTVLMCPHGGTVMVVTTNTQVMASGSPVLLSTDVFTVVGCSLSSSGTTPPCTTVEWLVPAMQNSVTQQFVLTTDSVGLCIGSVAPGPPIVTPVQTSVTGL